MERLATRLMTMTYGRGIVRGQVENTNLCACSTSANVNSAQAIRTCLTDSFFGREHVGLIEHLNDGRISDEKAVVAEVDMRNKRHRKVTFRDVGICYGRRPFDDRVWYLSPYELVSELDVFLLSYPQALTDADHARHHVDVTED